LAQIGKVKEAEHLYTHEQKVMSHMMQR
jgi:hypothetical protein